MKAVLLALSLGLVACAHQSQKHSQLPAPQPIHNYAVGYWENPYRGDPKFAGADVRQFGECPEEAPRYEGKHPCCIWFFFWDGRVRQVTYEPDGKILNDSEWKDKVRPGDPEWAEVDFSCGSDPNFRHHSDPRPRKKTN